MSLAIQLNTVRRVLSCCLFTFKTINVNICVRKYNTVMQNYSITYHLPFGVKINKHAKYQEGIPQRCREFLGCKLI